MEKTLSLGMKWARATRAVVMTVALAGVAFAGVAAEGVAAPVAAQGRSVAAPVAAASPRGMCVFLGGIPSASATVLRAERDGGYTPVGEVRAPASREELADRVARFAPQFPGLPVPDEAEIARMWEYLAGGGGVDRFPASNVPVTHLAFGAAFLDTGVSGGTWRYRVEGGGRTRAADTPPGEYPAPAGPAAAGQPEWSFDGTRVQASWKLADPREVGGLVVRRRTARRGDFAPWSGIAGFAEQDGTVRARVLDPEAEPGTVIEYELTLVDRFANPGPPSVVRAETYPADGTPIVRRLQAKDLGEGHRVRVSWELRGGAYAGSLRLERSVNFDGPFEPVITLPPGSKEYVDTVPEANENSYYRLIVSGARGDSAPSAVVAGLVTAGEPPLPPQSVDAEPVEGGIVVSWRGEGPYVIGYRVYRASGPEGEARLVSDLVPADSGRVSFTDTSADLSGRFTYAYAVRSVSDAYVESEPSEIGVASPLIAYAIATPMNLRHVLEEGRVHLFWEDLSRTEPTLFGYDVFRRAVGERDFVAVSEPTFAPRANRWTDTTAVPGAAYEYRVEAVDLRGTRSAPSATARVELSAVPGPAPPAGFRAARVAGGVLLSWQASEAGAAGFRLYRTDAGGERAPVAGLDGSATSFTDTAARPGATVTYSMTALGPDGREGDPTAPVAVRP